MNPKFTKAQLTEQVATLTKRLAEANDKVAQLTALCADRANHHRKVVNALTPYQRPVVPVYEWDPMVPGDFNRALAEAKANNGRVQRIRAGAPR